MGVLTSGITRVRDEILALRQERGELLAGLEQEALDRRSAVSGMLAQFSKDLAEIARRTRESRLDFVAELRRMVSGLQREVRDELDGARQALVTLRMTPPNETGQSKTQVKQDSKRLVRGNHDPQISGSEAVEHGGRERESKKQETEGKKRQFPFLKRHRK